MSQQPQPERAAQSAEGLLPDAPAGARIAGHCVVCDRMVERRADGSCPEGHAPGAVSGSIELAPGEPLPVLPKMNWGALSHAPDLGYRPRAVGGRVLRAAVGVRRQRHCAAPPTGRLGWRVVAWATLVGTLAFQYEYACTANRLAWRRASEHASFETYLRRERFWAVAMGALLAVFVVWGYAFLTRGS